MEAIKTLLDLTSKADILAELDWDMRMRRGNGCTYENGRAEVQVWLDNPADEPDPDNAEATRWTVSTHPNWTYGRPQGRTTPGGEGQGRQESIQEAPPEAWRPGGVAARGARKEGAEDETQSTLPGL